MKIKGIIFDFDGTLFNSMSIWENVGTDYLKSVGCIAEHDLYKKLKTLSMFQSAQYLQENYHLPYRSNEIINGINQMIEDFYLYQTMPKENVISVLQALQKIGIHMCIATATDKYLVEAALKRCHMDTYFEKIFTCSEIGHGKDEPDIYEAAKEWFHMEKSEIAIFEDAFYAGKTAKEAGFFVVGVFDEYEEQTDKLKKITDVYIKHFSELNLTMLNTY